MCHLEPTAVGVEGMWVWIASGCRERQWVRRVCGCGERQWARRVCGCRERIGRAGNGIRQGFVSGQQVGYGRDGRLVTVGMEGWLWSGWKVGYGRDGRLVTVCMEGWLWSGWKVGHGRDGRLVMVGMEGWLWSGWEVGQLLAHLTHDRGSLAREGSASSHHAQRVAATALIVAVQLGESCLADRLRGVPDQRDR